ncbi:MAG TPA: hypothetical protein PLL26_07435 [Candidatus Dojkabacteria bacterium]|nr:hypothetical protein [Candidatus Dojkabacteria bacterium]
MEKVIVIKTNGFVDVLDSTFKISDDYISKEDVDNMVEDYDNGIFKIYNIKTSKFTGQIGNDGFWEIPPHSEVDSFKVKKLCNLTNYITKAEKEFNKKRRHEKELQRLREYVYSLSNKKERYDLCKVFNCDKLALRKVNGHDFVMYETLIEFDNDSVTLTNLKRIKTKIKQYFKNIKHDNT